jgi:hypothetical protein
LSPADLAPEAVSDWTGSSWRTSEAIDLDVSASISAGGIPGSRAVVTIRRCPLLVDAVAFAVVVIGRARDTPPSAQAPHQDTG